MHGYHTLVQQGLNPVWVTQHRMCYLQGWQGVCHPHNVQVHEQDVLLQLQSSGHALQLGPAQLHPKG